MNILAGKTIVIGGVGDGMGTSLALRAAAQGARVVLSARTASRIETIAARIVEQGGEAVAVPCDMGVLNDCRRVVEAARDKFGGIDGVAMVACMNPDQKKFADADPDFKDWQPIVEFNFFGVLQFVKACLTTMEDGSSVALVGSVSQDEAWERTAPYAAAKAGLAATMRVMALEYGPQGIRFNMMCCGGIANDPFYTYVGDLANYAGHSYDEQLALMVKDYPLGYVPTPDEYAYTLIFLLSDMSKAVNGQNIHANGGLFMKS
jgi:NAD(P)-dependent dehydrogenase (short-subunit alcohol dehydrogenase family)